MGKTCLIVGASGDIGVAIARRLASENYSLLLHYNQNRKVINDLIHELPDETILGVVQADLSNQEGINTFVSQLQLPINNVVFASGRSEYGLFQETSEKVMDEMLSIHVKAPWLITKHLIPDLVTARLGNIIFVTSIWGDVGASCEVVYSSVKGAQNSFVRSLAKELAPNGVSVNAVSPGFIDTKMNRQFSKEETENIIQEIPLNRAGSTVEVAHVVAFLLDDRSSYIQGEIINVTGAW